jgi:GT2 family glycosyltransferase
LAERHGIDARIHYNNANLGVAKGNNQGIQMALDDGCSHVLLANNDTAFDAGTFSALLAPILEDGEVSTTCRISFYDEPDRYWYENGEIHPFRALTPHLHHSPKPERGDKYYVRYAPTCFLMLCRDVFSRTGLMDERYFVYFDDSDFVWRMHQHHMRIRLVPRMLVKHKVSASTGGDESPFSLFYMHRNRMRFARKHNPWYLVPAALFYICATRLIRTRNQPEEVRRQVWRGLRAGFTA